MTRKGEELSTRVEDLGLASRQTTKISPLWTFEAKCFGVLFVLDRH